jgi:hypothetical protein
MFKVEIDPTAQVVAMITGVLVIGHDTPVLAQYLTKTGRMVDGKPELIGSVARATFRDVYAMLAYLAEGAAMIGSDEHPIGEVHRTTVETDDSLNTVEITLSPAALLGINRILPPQYRLSERSHVGVVDWVCVALRRVPDLAEFFPRGKWATIQELERACLFRYSDLYEPARKMGLL